MGSLLPSFGFSSTRQYSGRSGDVAGGDNSFTAFSSGVLSPVTAAILGGAAILSALIIFRGGRGHGKTGA